MTPTAKSELSAYARRIRKEAKERDRQFRAPWLRIPSVQGFVIGVLLGLVSVWLLAVWRWA